MLRLATKHTWASCIATAALQQLQQLHCNSRIATAALQQLHCNSRAVDGDEAVFKGMKGGL
jgi:hypothetical protein